MSGDIRYFISWNSAKGRWEPNTIIPHKDNLTGSHILDMFRGRLSSLDTAQVSSLTTAQIAAIPANQISALQNTQLKVLTTTQIAALTTSQLSTFSPTQIAVINAATYTSTRNSRNMGVFPSSINPGSTTIMI